MASGKVRELLRSLRKLCAGLHRFIVAVQPWAVLLAVIGLLLSAYELDTGRRLRQASLFVSATEVAQMAREASTAENERRKLEMAKEKSKPEEAEGEKLESEADEGEPTKLEIGQSYIFQAISRSGVSLRGLHAKDLSIMDVDLSGVDLRDANLSGVSIYGVAFANADLSNSLLSEATLGPSNSTKTVVCSTLTNANLERSQLTDTFFAFTDLAGANFRDTLLGFNGLCHVDLSGADFTRSRILAGKIALYGTDLSNVRGFSEEHMPRFCGAGARLPNGRSVRACPEGGVYAVFRNRCQETTKAAIDADDHSVPTKKISQCDHLLSRSRTWLDQLGGIQQ